MTTTTTKSLRIGYGLNGFTDHRLPDALAVLADLGYDGVALTLDHAHLDPLAADLPARVARVAGLLDRHGLSVVVETGGRFVLDPARKHWPTLVSDEGRPRRVDLLSTALRVAADLGSPVVSFWSGTLPDGATAGRGWERLVDGVGQLLPLADRLGVDLAMEPEPGMFVDRVAGVLETRSRLGDPERLRVTLDVGHIVCNEDDSVPEVVASVAPLLANVQIDDMRRGTHEHLPFGEGELDLPSAVGALVDAGFGGLVHVELPRHTFAAPELARRSMESLTEALDAAGHPRREEVLTR